ncbi:MAG TPA: type II CAAX endopeptidase family protein [Alloacidobacterium sp.]|nr:type II CAAX endopeptidase family protein [Alloacidobacterium sp.]
MQQANEIEPRVRTAIAPWWHTVLLVGLLLGFSVLGTLHHPSHTLEQHHVSQYLLTLAWEWILATLVLWGIRMRGVPLRQLLGARRATWHGWKEDFILAAAFWVAATIVLAALGILFKLAHFSTPEKTITQLAPQNAVQFLLWIVLSISAGICEELAFRGYLLQQFAHMGRRISVGIVLSSLVFGVAHGYEGVSGMIAITVYGALFCALAIRRESLRAGMMAHAWHDIFSGIALMILKHAHVL